MDEIPDMNQIVGEHDLVFVTLDTLRYDVAARLHAQGRTPTLAAALPDRGWERRHSPGSFTFAAHQAFFAGFLPTPARPGRHPRLFAARFPGSETTASRTCVFDEPNIVAGLAARGYHTACIGGVGFFNKQTGVGRVLPEMFEESHWSPEMGVTDAESTRHQVALAREVLARTPGRVFLFLNISALHQPNCHYIPGRTVDSLETHAAALEYIDAEIGGLFDALRARGPAFCIFCGDHGTAYGEDGFSGHRLAHQVVWDVPYAHFFVGEAP